MAASSSGGTSKATGSNKGEEAGASTTADKTTSAVRRRPQRQRQYPVYSAEGAEFLRSALREAEETETSSNGAGGGKKGVAAAGEGSEDLSAPTLARSTPPVSSGDGSGRGVTIGIRGRYRCYDDDSSSSSDGESSGSSSDQEEDEGKRGTSSRGGKGSRADSSPLDSDFKQLRVESTYHGDHFDEDGHRGGKSKVLLDENAAGSSSTLTPSVLLPLPVAEAEAGAEAGTKPPGDAPSSSPSSPSDGGRGTTDQQVRPNPNPKRRRAIVAPTAVLAPGRSDWSGASVCGEYLRVAQSLTPTPRNGAEADHEGGQTAERGTVLVLLLRSGRFAGGVFVGDRCVVHRTCTRYTTRRGQGGAQSSRDSAKGKAKSIGAQLRRAGEVALREDVRSTLFEWRDHVRTAEIVFLACPRAMRKGLFDDCSEVLSRDDSRIRSVPMSIGRPKFEEVCRVHSTLLSLTVRDMTVEEVETVTKGVRGDGHGEVQVDGTSSSAANGRREKSQTEERSRDGDEVDDTTTDAALPSHAPLTPLHEAAAAGDVDEIRRLLQLVGRGRSDATDDPPVEGAVEVEAEVDVDARAGPKEMTPLHLAAAYDGGGGGDGDDGGEGGGVVDAAATPSSRAAASCVTELLLAGRANPCVVDGHGRVPYYLAQSDKVRDAFRLARGELGEGYCDWDGAARVGPALSDDLLRKRKEKAAEKKRRQRARQKEKKARERAEAEEEERARKEREEEERREEEAKRVRDGLQPKKKSAPTNTCDFCQRVAKGMRRSQMYSRLDYVYCSSDCVRKHQRELTAAAATARLGD